MTQHKPYPRKNHGAIDCLILRETDKAILVTPKQTEETIWFPLSQVSYICIASRNSENPDSLDKMSAYPDTVHVATWILNKAGLEYSDSDEVDIEYDREADKESEL